MRDTPRVEQPLPIDAHSPRTHLEGGGNNLNDNQSRPSQYRVEEPQHHRLPFGIRHQTQPASEEDEGYGQSSEEPWSRRHISKSSF